MKLNGWLFALAMLALPAAASPTSYTMTFTGGFCLNTNCLPQVTPYAPDSGSFTYDPSSGFSNFVVTYKTDTFNLTSSANAPNVCNASGLNCSPGTPAQAFLDLTTVDTANWFSFESFSGSTIVTNLVLSPYEDSTVGAIFGTGPQLDGFVPGQSDLVRSGTFTVAAGSGGTGGGPGGGPGSGPGSAVPEPGATQMLLVGALGLFGLSCPRFRNRANSSLR